MTDWHRHINAYFVANGIDCTAEQLEKYLLQEPRPSISWLKRRFHVKDWRTMDKWVKGFDKK